ncbi:MAG: hypothetical protein ACI88H_000663 [Cocleimonas sp.]|jgi:hypothetical protein
MKIGPFPPEQVSRLAADNPKLARYAPQIKLQNKA